MGMKAQVCYWLEQSIRNWRGYGHWRLAGVLPYFELLNTHPSFLLPQLIDIWHPSSVGVARGFHAESIFEEQLGLFYQFKTAPKVRDAAPFLDVYYRAEFQITNVYRYGCYKSFTLACEICLLAHLNPSLILRSPCPNFSITFYSSSVTSNSSLGLSFYR